MLPAQWNQPVCYDHFGQFFRSDPDGAVFGPDLKRGTADDPPVGGDDVKKIHTGREYRLVTFSTFIEVNGDRVHTPVLVQPVGPEVLETVNFRNVAVEVDVGDTHSQRNLDRQLVRMLAASERLDDALRPQGSEGREDEAEENNQETNGFHRTIINPYYSFTSTHW